MSSPAYSGVHTSEGLQVNKGLPSYPYSSDASLSPEVVPYRQEEEPKYFVEQQASGGQKGGTICGLQKRTFWIVLAVAVLVIGAAVGGGVGGALANKKSTKSADQSSSTSAIAAASTSSSVATTSSSSTSATSSSTTSSSTTKTSTTICAATPFPTTGFLALDCPPLNNTEYSTVPAGSSTNYTFEIFCGRNYDTGGVDLLKTKTYSLQDCLDLCAEKNDSGVECATLVWSANLTQAIGLTGGNCWLKSTVGIVGQGEAASLGAAAIFIPS